MNARDYKSSASKKIKKKLKNYILWQCAYLLVFIKVLIYYVWLY